MGVGVEPEAADREAREGAAGGEADVAARTGELEGVGSVVASEEALGVWGGVGGAVSGPTPDTAAGALVRWGTLGVRAGALLRRLREVAVAKAQDGDR